MKRKKLRRIYLKQVEDVLRKKSKDKKKERRLEILRKNYSKELYTIEREEANDYLSSLLAEQ